MNTIAVGYSPGPVYNLPPEILEEVFVQCLPTFPALSHEVAPLLLCRVCRTWRDVVFASSRLWSSLSIDMTDLITKNSLCPKPNATALPAMEFLQRSKNRALSLQFKTTLPTIFDHPEWKTNSDSMLTQFHQRVQNLDLTSSWLNKFLYSLPEGIAFPRLSDLTVTSSSGPSFDSLPLPVTAFAASHFLQRVTYNAYISYETVLNLAIPWEQLTHLTLNDLDYASWNYVFPRCPNLRSGTFFISGSPQPSPKPVTEITYPFLTSLSIRSIQSSRSPLSLNGFNFPDLRDLTLGWNHSPGFDTGFLSTIRNLERLAISSPQCHFINMGDVLSILSLTPSISQLHVINDHCNSDLFAALTYHGHQQLPLLPQLKKLSVELSHWSSMCDEAPIIDAVKKMASSRWWIYPNSKVRQLESLCVATTQQNVRGVKEALRHLTGAGLSLETKAFVTASTDSEHYGYDRN